MANTFSIYTFHSILLTSAKPTGSKFLAVFSPAKKLNGIGSGPSPPTIPLANSYSADDDDDDTDGGGANAVTLLVSMVTMSVVAATANLVMVNLIYLGEWSDRLQPAKTLSSSLNFNSNLILTIHTMKSVAIATVALLAASASAFAPSAPITVKSAATASTALNAVWDD